MSDHPLIRELVPGALCLGLEAADAEAVIRELAGRLQASGHVRETFADAVVARERSMPTGLPLGHEVNVAIPHADPQHVLKPGLAIATLATPVTFANMEDADEQVRVGLVFLLALNDKDRQIDMLQAVIAAAQDEEVLERMRGAGSLDELSAALAT